MGRPKEYDRRKKLEQARRLFNKQGFSATSMADLVDALGINRRSLYAEFGSKHELFEAALTLHHETKFAAAIGALEQADAGLAEIRAALMRWGAGARGPGHGVGCLICNTASEISANDPAARKHVDAYLKRMTSAFRNALENARASGELAPLVEVEAEARFFTNHAIGQLTLIRSKVAREIVESAAEVALTHLASLATD